MTRSGVAPDSFFARSWKGVVHTREPRWARGYRLALILTDAVMVTISIFATYSMAVTGDQMVSGAKGVSYLATAPLCGLAWVLALSVTGSRSPWTTGAGLEEYRRVIRGSLYVFGLIAVVSYLVKAQFSRGLFVALLPIGVVLLLVGRWMARMVLNHARRSRLMQTPCAVCGPPEEISRVVADLRRHTDAGLRPTSVLPSSDGPLFCGEVSVLRSTEELLEDIRSHSVEAVIATEGFPARELRQLAWELEKTSTALIVTPRVVDVVGQRVHTMPAPGVSLVHVDLPQFTGWNFILKRAFDVIFSSLVLILLSPLFLVIALLIKHEDGGPVLFTQERVGRNGEPFTIHKFRSMSVDAESKIDELIEQSGGQALFFKLEDDPRVTRIGKILRRYSLDELPQFWSVLVGGMSVVGPRPQMAREVAEYRPEYHRRLPTKPGITGLWQVSGRSDLTPEEGMRLDLSYVENWSPLSDVLIIMKTVSTIFKSSSGAY